nr:MAG TPA: hypothetical protein [Bacteriophage sp.]
MMIMISQLELYIATVLSRIHVLKSLCQER